MNFDFSSNVTYKFNSNNKECAWVDRTYYDKSCDTADLSIQSEKGCHDYYPDGNCTTKRMGGQSPTCTTDGFQCTIMKKCSNIQHNKHVYKEQMNLVYAVKENVIDIQNVQIQSILQIQNVILFILNVLQMKLTVFLLLNVLKHLKLVVLQVSITIRLENEFGHQSILKYQLLINILNLVNFQMLNILIIMIVIIILLVYVQVMVQVVALNQIIVQIILLNLHVLLIKLVKQSIHLDLQYKQVNVNGHLVDVQLSTCTYNGNNCIVQSTCNNYITNDSFTVATGTDGKCYWNNNTCIAMKCEDYPISFCSLYSSTCIQDGSQCVSLKDCSSYKNQTACDYGSPTNVCAWIITSLNLLDLDKFLSYFINTSK
ncbi:unnamed protein product [Paramecium sonneborni]|uniref:Transmembrane protein n=1 Tax=Paramecium sonneborni TaxID=65129 RepID=A0A8S1RNM6_9CILI|nr:unnamed protein product [Paramecium sonneborni]